MDRKEVKDFIREVVGPNTQTLDTDGWVSLPCPLSLGRIPYTCRRRNIMPARIHGMSRDHEGKRTPEYRAWLHMKQRCYNPKAVGYAYYGGRGITVCSRWLKSFSNFYEDMGPKPDPALSLEREDVNGHYDPSNCRWATAADQTANRRSGVKSCRKLTRALIRSIRHLSRLGYSTRAIRERTGIGKSLVWRLVSGSLEIVGFREDGVALVLERRGDGPG